MHCLLANNECSWLQFLHKYGPSTWDLDIDIPIKLSSGLDDRDGNIRLTMKDQNFQNAQLCLLPNIYPWQFH